MKFANNPEKGLQFPEIIAASSIPLVASIGRVFGEQFRASRFACWQTLWLFLRSGKTNFAD